MSKLQFVGGADMQIAFGLALELPLASTYIIK